MGMTTRAEGSTRRIGRFAAVLTRVAVGGESVALWQVDDLERYVDRQALLAHPDPPEPPYWAHLWSGAQVLAAAVPRGAGRVIEVGCGLGLPGLVAARRGARVTFVDRAPDALAFVRASAAANGVATACCLVADFAAPAVRTRFDLLLAAEVLYDRRAFEPLARAIRDSLAPGGRALVSDARRIDTRGFDEALDGAGLRWHAREERVREDGFPVVVRLVEIRLPGG
jgi:predicted nicotinamide N-methyase